MVEDQNDADILVVSCQAAQVQAEMQNVMQEHLVEIWRALEYEKDLYEMLDGLPESD